MTSTPSPTRPGESVGHSRGAPGRSPHKWMMLLMCVPLVLIGIWQFATGGGAAGLFGGLACMGMMLAMHAVMGGAGHQH
ncbi:hypothetical protein GCM10009785_15060 [Brooklawnia cerclae]|uniref:DUF2933 domain-containing protein n=1 Tax=Brooklawnia cerclae TaxID=349934 RepID=A0ABX0SMF5_9ACTN|nr:hypothetical protein [Brooklawnia cerclae]NIH57922.1 hypothetical protein [Brooklawnia cerclae]